MLVIELQNLKLSKHSILIMVSSGMLIIELQNLKLNDNTGLVTVENAVLHTEQILLLKKGSKERKMIALLQPGKGVQLGSHI